MSSLVVNAREAMPLGGIVTIATSNRRLPDDAPRQQLVLSVSDTGSGMTEDIRARMFEPFFGTKSDAGQSGLGLTTVFSIVHRAGRHCRGRHQSGRWNHRSRLAARAHGTAATDPTKRIVRFQGTSEPGERVLIVDTDGQLGGDTASALLSLGLTVSSVASAPEALDVADRYRPTVVIVDIDIGAELEGLRLAEAVRRR